MEMRPVAILHCMLMLTFLLAGCTSSSSDTCEAGDQNGCDCMGGGQGIQVCNEDGSAWGDCVCPDGDVDGDEPVDGDTVADGDEMSDGDEPADGDETVDGDEMVDGDAEVDGDEIVDGDMDGDVEAEGEEEIPIVVNGHIDPGLRTPTYQYAPVAIFQRQSVGGDNYNTNQSDNYSYDEHARLLAVWNEEFDEGGRETNYEDRTFYFYKANGYIERTEQQSYVGPDNWVTNHKTTYEYYEFNMPVKRDTFKWETDVWVEVGKEDMVYDEYHRMIRREYAYVPFDSEDGQLVPSSRDLYKYDREDHWKVVKVTSLYYQNEAWGNGNKTDYTYDDSDRILTKTSMTWVDTRFKITSLQTYEYGENGLIDTIIVVRYDEVTGAVTNYYRFVYNYNESNRQLSRSYQTSNSGEEDSWVENTLYESDLSDDGSSFSFESRHMPLGGGELHAFFGDGQINAYKNLWVED